MVPSDKEILALHKKYAPDELTFDIVYTHCKIVSEIAAQLLRIKHQEGIDLEFVKAACMLHDIGVYVLFKNGVHVGDPYITHGLRGQEILEREGIDASLCRVASHHTGTGLRKQDIVERNIPLPVKDYLAESDEEKLVMYADKFHSKTPKFNSFDSYKAYVLRFGESNVQTFEELASKFGKPDLEELSRKYGHPLM